MLAMNMTTEPIERLRAFLATRRRIVALTGAGVSTDSGIPDYRDAEGAWKRAEPMRYQEFIAAADARQRYWARALVGWRMFAGVAPNAAHFALAGLESAGRLSCLITQNVDGLHQRAGSRSVIDLHGRVDMIECLDCRAVGPRAPFQQALETGNPDWTARSAPMAPDGDALLDGLDFSAFAVPACDTCGGRLKPHVVFFGESVPRERVQAAMAALAGADALLVAGTSLMVASGYRFVRAARELGVPIALVNLGRTRADAEIDLRVEGRCAEVLPAALAGGERGEGSGKCQAGSARPRV